MIRPPETLYLYYAKEPRRWCVAGSLHAPSAEREEFRSYGAATDWAKEYLGERNGGEIHCHDRTDYHAVTLRVVRGDDETVVEVEEVPAPGHRARPSGLAERAERG